MIGIAPRRGTNVAVNCVVSVGCSLSVTVSPEALSIADCSENVCSKSVNGSGGLLLELFVCFAVMPTSLIASVRFVLDGGPAEF